VILAAGLAGGCATSKAASSSNAEAASEPVGEASAAKKTAGGQAQAADRGVRAGKEADPPRDSLFGDPLRNCRMEIDYNRCIVERLEGEAESERELVALIQSQRMLGQTAAAMRTMERFIARYPEAPMTDVYRSYLGDGPAR
jgi:hypothetical protein